MKSAGQLGLPACSSTLVALLERQFALLSSSCLTSTAIEWQTVMLSWICARDVAVVSCHFNAAHKVGQSHPDHEAAGHKKAKGGDNKVIWRVKNIGVMGCS